jgi:hypothetical protein
MLSSVLNSERAIAVNIEIMRAFVKLRELLVSNKELARRFDQLEARVDKRRRILVSALSTLARTLGVSLEELLGEESAAAAKNAVRHRSCSSRWSASNTCCAPSSASSCRSSIPCSLSRIAEDRS